MKIAFQGGGFYTQQGQRIGAWIEKIGKYEELMCFVDFDRQIDGCFPFRSSGQFCSPADYARHVMHMYDYGQYTYAEDRDIRTRIFDTMRQGYDCFIQADCNVLARFSR